MMVNIKLHTKFYFNSAHYLKDYKGKCANMHGHTWMAEVWVKGNEYNLENDMLLDFNIVNEVKNKIDHKILNETVNFNPTAENIAFWIYKFMKKFNSNLAVKVRVCENILNNDWVEVGDEHFD